MNRDRFEHLLEAYGGDFRRWPEAERAAGEAFAAANADTSVLLAEARTLDAALDDWRDEAPEPELLARRILAKAPKRASGGGVMRIGWALAACAVFGVVLGYGGGMLAPVADGDDAYFVMAFEAPMAFGEEG